MSRKPTPSPTSVNTGSLQATHPQAYEAGQRTARGLISSPPDRERIGFCLRLVEAHLALWPLTYAKNGLTEPQRARSCGFRDTLREYTDQIGQR